MGDFNQRFAAGLNNMHHTSGTRPAPSPTPAAGPNIWELMMSMPKDMYNELVGSPQAQAVTPQKVVPSPTPVQVPNAEIPADLRTGIRNAFQR